jgi:hypothetical protein
MANKTLHEYSALTTANICTGPTVDIGDNAFELKPGLINMVQANQFSGKSHDDASAHLQHFLEICSTFTINGVTKDAIAWERLSSGSTPTKTRIQHGTSAPPPS